MVSAHYLIADMFRIGVGIGGAPQQDIGTPAGARAVPVRLCACAQARRAEGRRRRYGQGRHSRQRGRVPGYAWRAHRRIRRRTAARRRRPIAITTACMDADDLCPDEPVGDHPDPKRPGCPAKDSDGDGVYDYEDHCPDTPAGRTRIRTRRAARPSTATATASSTTKTSARRFRPARIRRRDPAKLGCPKPDRDHDTVPDDVDACPDKPGAPSPDPKKNGCPGLVEVKNGVIVIFQPVFFATNKDTILKKSFPVLNAVADALKAEPEIKKIMIEGHTDNRGKASRNMELSDRRARSVLNVPRAARASRRSASTRRATATRSRWRDEQDVEGPRRQPPRRVPHRRPAAGRGALAPGDRADRRRSRRSRRRRRRRRRRSSHPVAD